MFTLFPRMTFTALITFCLTFASVVIPQDGCCGGNYWRQRAQWNLQLKPRTKNSIVMCENPFNWSLMDFVTWWQNDVENDEWCKIPFFSSSSIPIISLSSQGIDCFSFSLIDWLISWYFDPKVLKIRFSDLSWFLTECFYIVLTIWLIAFLLGGDG